MSDVETVLECRNWLGESPVWHPQEKALYWVDAQGDNRRVLRLDPATGAQAEWPVDSDIGSIGLRRKGGLIAALKSGFHFLDLASGALEQIVNPEAHLANNRLNDGKCDRRGRYWCGSLTYTPDARSGRLYRLTAALDCTPMAEGVQISNGIAFSPDDKVMYYADSVAKVVWAYDFDIDAGCVANRRVFLSTAGEVYMTDGATVDADGCYWTAHIFAGEVAQYDPQGRLMRRIEVPVRHPTMCVFGGAALDVLYVTAGAKFLKPDALAAEPQAGGLFAIHNTGARGLAEPFFAG